MVRDWAQTAAQTRLSHTKQLADAIADLERFPIFREGARSHARNCLESLFLRSAFLDTFFQLAPVPTTETSSPYQRPYYLVPGLPARTYYDKNDFPWAKILEDNYAVIAQELAGILSDGSGFGNYQSEFDLTMPGWNTYSLWLYGKRHEENAARCPKTIEILESLPNFENGEWILFSALNGNSRIPPHVGPMNGVLRGHLAMIVPPDCGLRVAGQDSGWEQGKVIVFDDSFVHEVWNHSDQLRIVLFLNFWHPLLGPDERAALCKLRDAYHSNPTGKRWLDRQEHPLPATLQKA